MLTRIVKLGPMLPCHSCVKWVHENELKYCDSCEKLICLVCGAFSRVYIDNHRFNLVRLCKHPCYFEHDNLHSNAIAEPTAVIPTYLGIIEKDHGSIPLLKHQP